MVSPSVQIIFGGASIGGMGAEFVTVADTKEVLRLLEEGGVKTIDTARTYINSENLLGQAGAASRFSIDTKYPGGFGQEPSSKEGVIASIEESLRTLQTDQIDVYYVHAPDRRTSLEEMLSGLDEAYQAGKFKRLGLSNFLPEEVEEVVRMATEKNYIRPTIYQGNYNAVARHAESMFLPILRKHGIAYYAYSPIAGGFLTKDVEQLISGGEGRWDPNQAVGSIYNKLYGKPGMFEGLKLWGKISEESGIPKAELAYRWVAYHSALKGEFGDGIIFGSRNGKQLSTTLKGLNNGPLPEDVAQQIERVWKIVEVDAPVDNFNSLAA